MITVLAVLALGGLGGGRLALWWMRRRSAPRIEGTEGGEGDATPKDVRLVGFPVALGDVVLLAQGEEAWLAGAILFREQASHRDGSGAHDRTVAALFVAPDRGGDRAVYARPSPDPSLDWLQPLPPDALIVGAEPPSSLEYEGRRYERVRRLPLSMTCVGTGAPDLGPDVILGEYTGGAGASLLVLCATPTRVFSGRRLTPGLYEILPGS